jgi:hypothetical protein
MNARKEIEQFLEDVTHLSSWRKLLCATICYDPDGMVIEEAQTHDLVMGYTDSQYEEWLESLNFEYDAGWGCQLLYGNLWFNDNTWASRGEYDGKEWWELDEVPLIPNSLRMSKPNYKEVAEKFVASLSFEHLAEIVHGEDEQAKQEAEKTSDEFRKEFSEMLKRLSPRPEDE